MSTASTTDDEEEGSRPPGRASTIAAFAANIGVAVAKLVAWLFTGSASMLAEAIHSVADSANQGLLLWGQHRSTRSATAAHPFGFGRERYFWAFVVAVVLFTGGSLFALVEGEEKLRIPHRLESYPWSAGVLLAAMVLEALSLRTARREALAARRNGETWRRFVRRTTVPEIAVVLLEDSGALIGLGLAFAGTTAAAITGNPRFDALGSVGIGLLLGVIAFTLAKEMKSLLIGEGAAPRERDRIADIVLRDEAVVGLDDLRTEHIGPESVLVVGTVRLGACSADELSDTIRRIERAVVDEVEPVCLVYLSPRLTKAGRRSS